MAGDPRSKLTRDPRKVLYRRRASHFLDVASKQERSKGNQPGADPNQLLAVSPMLDFTVWAKLVFKGGWTVKRELDNSEVAQVLDWRKDMSFAIADIR